MPTDPSAPPLPTLEEAKAALIARLARMRSRGRYPEAQAANQAIDNVIEIIEDDGLDAVLAAKAGEVTQEVKQALDCLGNIINDAPFRGEERDGAWQAFLENRKIIEAVLQSGALRVREEEGQGEQPHGAGLIHQTIPDVAETEPRLTRKEDKQANC